MNNISIPVFELDSNGKILPNYVFHRGNDKVHSRCIEYPWVAAHHNPNAARILDVGSSQGDKNWINWLKSLGKEIYFTDYDDCPPFLSGNIFFRADVRHLPFTDNFFDEIFAVSVIEHIGLASPQVKSNQKPKIDNNGDIKAFRELIRVLKPNGKLYMTIPFGHSFKLILGKDTRCYNRQSLNRFKHPNITLEKLEIWEYLPKNKDGTLKTKILNYIISHLPLSIDLPFPYTWEKVSIENIKAKQKWHTDCVAMGIWIKHN